jgi:hypothetical protein
VGRSSQHLTHHGLQRGCLTQYQTLPQPSHTCYDQKE